MASTVCPKCEQLIEHGRWPFCPHPPMEIPVAVQSDELFNFKQENFGDQPEYFDSKKAMLKRADDLGLRPVGDGDKYKGAYGVTAKTLEDARVLLSRGSQTAETVTCQTASFTVTEIPHVG